MAGSIHRRSLKEGARMERPEENINRGDIYYAYLEPAAGSEQSGIRPVVIVQNDTGNHFSPTVIIAAISSKRKKRFLPTHVPIHSCDRLRPGSMVLAEQIRTMDKMRLMEKIGTLSPKEQKKVDWALAVSFGLCEKERKK